MKLTELETEIETPKGTRYLVRRKRFIPVTNLKGQTRYWWRNRVPMPRCLNRLWAWLGR